MHTADVTKVCAYEGEWSLKILPPYLRIVGASYESIA